MISICDGLSILTCVKKGVPITKNGLNERWTVADVRSKGFGNARIVSNTLELGIQVEGRAIVSLSAFANRDLNIRTKRLRSSELTWQTWAMTARKYLAYKCM